MAGVGAEIIYEGEHLRVSRSVEPGRTVWRFEGEVSAKVPDLKDLLDSLAERVSVEADQVLVDVSAAHYVSSPFIGLLVRLVSRLADRGMILELRGPNERIMDLLGIVGIAQSMKIYGADETLPEARG